MKDHIIIGGRQTGRSTLLVNSIFVHFIDELFKESFDMVVAAPTRTMVMDLKEEVVKKLDAADVNFSHSVDRISVGNRNCKFIFGGSSDRLRGLGFDFLFIDNVDLMSDEFTEYVDTCVRPQAVVIQTMERKTPFSRDVPHTK